METGAGGPQFGHHRRVNADVATRIASVLDLHAPVVGVEFLDKGYSFDRKFILHTRGEDRFLLRISDVAEARMRREEFENLAKARQAGVLCPEALHFGVSEEYSVCYMALSYISGECAEEALPRLKPAERYEVGVQAGRELRKIHGAIEPLRRVDDYAVRGEKFIRMRREAHALRYEFAGGARAERYVDDNLHLLKDRPTTFRHGDFHPGNLVLQGPTLAGVIDFNRSDFGDPIDEFYKTAWFGAPLSPEYANGLLRAYCGGEPDAAFWRLYNLYVAAVLPADLVWTHRYYPDQLARSFALVELIARTHDFDCGGPPRWWER